MEASRAHGEQLRVWSDLPCATETEVPPLNAVAEAVWDCGARGLKEEIGADCRRAGAKDGCELVCSYTNSRDDPRTPSHQALLCLHYAA